jgi:hypothetical protein
MNSRIIPGFATLVLVQFLNGGNIMLDHNVAPLLIDKNETQEEDINMIDEKYHQEIIVHS